VGASFRPSDEAAQDDGVVAEINITPLTDVFLVLLVIFMVTTSVIQNQGKQIDLPGAETLALDAFAPPPDAGLDLALEHAW